jgi:hypothetical protein
MRVTRPPKAMIEAKAPGLQPLVIYAGGMPSQSGFPLTVM